MSEYRFEIELSLNHLTMYEQSTDLITSKHPAYADIESCARATDPEPSCSYFQDNYAVDFLHYGPDADGKIQTCVEPTDEQMTTWCESAFPEHSHINFNELQTCMNFIVWAACANLIEPTENAQ